MTISDDKMNELLEEIAKLRKENEFLKAVDTLPVVQEPAGVYARVPPDAATRAKWAEQNRRQRTPASNQATDADRTLSMVSKVHNLREANSKLRKTTKR